MKKLLQNRTVAWVVLILAVALSCAWGMSRKDAREAKKPSALLDVKYQQWICDDAKLLSSATEKTLGEYNTAWNEKYYAVVAVASVSSLHGWEIEDYAFALGDKWGLGNKDMLLLMVKGGDWYVACGDSVDEVMTDTQQTKLKQAIDGPFYNGQYDEAAVSFFRQADVFYGQAMQGLGTVSSSNSDVQWTEESYDKPSSSGVSIGGVILLIVAIFAVWAILDRMRYNRYRQRYAGPTVGAPTVAYYPIFWGRRTYGSSYRPYRPASPARPARPQAYRESTASRPSSTRPSSTSGPSGSTRPGGGSFGGGRRGGFGGGKR